MATTISGMFVFPPIERIVYGRPAADAVRTEAERLDASRVFLLASGTMNRTTDEVSRMRAALGTRCAGVYDRMPPHTPRDAVIDAANAARAASADLIVTFGGGSVTDGGKMMRLCLQHDVTDAGRLDAFRISVSPDGRRTAPEFEGPRVPQVAVPTTLSAGEFHGQTGCTDNRRNVKESYRHPKMAPAVVILDPAPTLHTPLAVWLSTGMRALDHAVEGMCCARSNPVSDGIFLHAVRLLAGALPRIKRNPRDLDARLECQFAAWLSMSGRHAGITMGASHAIGHVLGGTCGVPHGVTSCLMLPHVLRYNGPVNADRQALVARAMGHAGEDAADVISAFIAELGLPRRLSEVGVTGDEFQTIAAHTMKEEWIHLNPRKIDSARQVLDILEAAA